MLNKKISWTHSFKLFLGMLITSVLLWTLSLTEWATQFPANDVAGSEPKSAIVMYTIPWVKVFVLMGIPLLLAKLYRSLSKR
ncbi:hypothetical protein RJ46_03945 [Vibrio sinaloensis]|nr:hypothetical protein RJ46_03945 [Vibrio sinaloensis]